MMHHSAQRYLIHGLAAVVLLTLLLTNSASAQASRVGIYISRGTVTLSGVLCGFDCTNPSNTGTARANVNDTLDVRVLGVAGQPGYVLVAGGATGPCPGVQIPGLVNGFLLNVNTLVPFAFGLAQLPTPARGTCGETGNGIVLPGLFIPPGTSGGLVSFQGIAMDGNTFHFTRPVQLTIL